MLAGAEKLPESLALAFEDTFGIRPMEGYGLTECSPVVAVNTFDWREPGYFQPGSRRGYVGQPLPGVSVRIVSSETYEPLGPDEPGLVLVKGPNVMQGYLGRDDLTRAAFRDGWYVTGDQGFLSEDGFLKITGRLSRFSKIGGEMVPHGLIEEALQQGVGADDQVFAVTAVGDEHKGEKLVVLHTLDDDEQVDAGLRTAWDRKGCPTCSSHGAITSSRSTAIPILGTGKLDLRASAQDGGRSGRPARSRERKGGRHGRIATCNVNTSETDIERGSETLTAGSGSISVAGWSSRVSEVDLAPHPEQVAAPTEEALRLVDEDW